MMMKDLFFIIFLFSIRGSVWSKLEDKSTAILNDIMEMCKAKYNTDTTPRSPMTQVGPDVVTIPRICACFPHKVCDLFHFGFGKVLCTFEDLGILETLGLSTALLCTFFPALIPFNFSNSYPEIHQLFFIVHIISDNILHRKDKTFTDLQDMLTYYSASYRSAGTPRSSRLEYLQLRNIIGPHSNILNVHITNAIPMAAAKIKSLRSTDPMVDKVIKELYELC